MINSSVQLAGNGFILHAFTVATNSASIIIILIQGGREQEGGRKKTILKQQREPEGGTIFVRQKWSPQAGREGQEGGRKKTILKKQRGDHICQTKVVPSARRTDRHLEIAYQGG